MRKVLITVAAGAVMTLVQPAAYADVQDDMKAAGCQACHEVDKKKVGPALKDISTKYQGKKVEEVMAGMKSKPVHKGALAKTTDSSLKVILEWVQTLK